MALFKAFDHKAMVNGESILSVVDGMGTAKDSAISILAKHGIEKVEQGKWYHQQSWLDAFKEISESMGAFTLFNIGKKIPENAQFPPEIDSIYKALSAIDVAYHMNQSIDGKSLFNPANGEMKEGIGHYGYKKENEKLIIMECNNPYDCDFDRGIIQTMAQRFKPANVSFIKVQHDDKQPCRKKSNESCTYTVSW